MQSAADLGVVVRGENLSVTSLALVSPALGLSGANTLKTREGRNLAEPAANEDVLKVISITRSKDLAVRAGVKLVDHLAVGGDNRVQGVGLELSVVGKGLEAHLRTPSVDDALVAGGRRGRSRSSRSDNGLGAGRCRCRCLSLVDNGAGGDRGVLLVDNGAGGGRGVLLVDNSSYGRSLVSSRGRLVLGLMGGLVGGLLSFG